MRHQRGFASSTLISHHSTANFQFDSPSKALQEKRRALKEKLKKMSNSISQLKFENECDEAHL